MNIFCQAVVSVYNPKWDTAFLLCQASESEMKVLPVSLNFLLKISVCLLVVFWMWRLWWMRYILFIELLIFSFIFSVDFIFVFLFNKMIQTYEHLFLASLLRNVYMIFRQAYRSKLNPGSLGVSISPQLSI